MDDRFDQEFYKSRWQHVLPVGPHGIQPYIRAARRSGLPAASPGLHRPAALLAGLARGVIAFGRWATIGIAKRPLLLQTEPPEQRPRPSLRLAHEAARPAVRTRRPPRRLSKAA